MNTPNISTYAAEPGVRTADATTRRVMKVPNEDNAGRTFVRRPTGNPWNTFTNFPWATGGNYPGHIVVSEDDTSTLFRIPLFNHSGNN
jgi:hypothetical protein